MDEIEKLIANTGILSTLKNQEPNKMSFFGPIFIANAEHNATALPQGRRHSEVQKHFATALFIYYRMSFYSVTCIRHYSVLFILSMIQ